jgi:hypothetical protein
MSEAPESPFLKFIRSNSDYPNCLEANIPLFEWIRTHGNDLGAPILLRRPGTRVAMKLLKN